ncbi:MAG: sulfatase-like hydrolase/transferase [bacterium]
MDRPNILFIMTDQQRFDCVGANGNKIIQTPNLDRLAARSANFSHCFVQSPVCTPSRACFFTGRYAHAHQNRVNYTPIKSDEVLMPGLLQEAGYRTGIVGKSHVYYRYPPMTEEGHRIGFDIVELHDGVGSTDLWSAYTKWRNENDPLRDICRYRALAKNVDQLKKQLPTNANPFRAAIDEQFTDTTWVGQRTCHHLKELASGDRPFFLFSSFWKPHSPFEVPEPFDALYNDVNIPLAKQVTLDEIQQLPLPLQTLILRDNNTEYKMDRERLEWIYRSYYGCISHIDREVGRMLATLEETGLEENTIVVFTSDHGDQLLEHGLMGKNTFFEASIRVPFMISYPGTIKPGSHEEFIETVDLLPTLFEMIGLPEPYHCQGRSMVSLITKSGRPYESRDEVFSENIIPEVFQVNHFRFDKGKGIKGIRHPDAKMVRTRRWKYNYYPEGYAELYDLENDPLEHQNVADDPKNKAVVDDLRGRILDWLITSMETEQIAPTWLI